MSTNKLNLPKCKAILSLVRDASFKVLSTKEEEKNIENT